VRGDAMEMEKEKAVKADDKIVKDFYVMKGSHIEAMGFASLVCFLMIIGHPSKGHGLANDINFPPNEEDCLNILTRFGLIGNKKSNTYKAFKNKLPPGTPLTFGYSILQDDLHDVITEIIEGDNFSELLYRMDIRDCRNFFEIFKYSLALGHFFRVLEFGEAPPLAALLHMILFDEIKTQIESKFFELRGFWTAKMEERKRGIKGGEKKTAIKEANLQVVAELLAKHPNYLIDKKSYIALITEAMKSTGATTDRTISNYLKEIMARKNEGFSKNGR